MKLFNSNLQEKFKEALVAVLPIVGIVMVLSFIFVPVTPGVLLSFLVGAVMVIAGMMFFTLGAEMSMTPMGERVGAKMTQSKNIWLIISLSFILGIIITISEPDLRVLAGLVPAIPNNTIIMAVAVGVGVFLVLALLRILLKLPLAPMLIGLYGVVFVLAFLVPAGFRAVAFDSGGVTTGPMTVPFIMALGVGVSSIRNDSGAADDSFGLVALCSVGPILTVMLLGLVFKPGESGLAVATVPQMEDSLQLWRMFSQEFPAYMGEIAVALLPIMVFFGLFQIISLKLHKKALLKILVGLGYTYVGLVLFLTGANVGFMPAGSYLGQVMASTSMKYAIVPIGALIGFFIVKAEPAVYVLNHQVEEMTDGAISASAMGISLSLGVAASVALAMIRVLTGIPILYFLIPGYAVALGLSFFVPKIFTAIAFDSGGVASGPMTATFLLPLAQGACKAVGGDLVADAFGVVAMVAMTPLITIQILGLIHRFKKPRLTPAQIALSGLDDDAIIEL